MRSLIKIQARWGAIVLPLLLVACSSAAPGMHFDSAEDERPDPSSAEVQQKPIMKPITPQLVKMEREKRAKTASEDIVHLTTKAQPYGIQGGDILSITVWDHPELTASSNSGPTANAPYGDNTASANGTPAPGFVVDHDGTIQFPYAGRLKVAGMTESQAQSALTGKLARYIRNPNVTLRVESYRSKRVYVDGEVKTPGVMSITDVPMTLMEALNRAGGLLPTADQSQITISRDGKNYNINLPRMVQRGVNPGSIMLANGDTVRVSSRDDSQIFVSGEVIQPRALQMHNGTLTLNEALGEVGGVNPQTAGRQIYVIRNAADKEPIVYHLDTKSPSSYSLAEQFDLAPKDVVYVDASPLTNWHRVISSLLPSALSQGVSAVGSVGGTVK